MGKWQAVVQGTVVAESYTLRQLLEEVEKLGYTREKVVVRYQPEPGEIRV